jgi:hypothetical protein
MAVRCGLNTKQIMVMLKLSQRQVLYALKTPPTLKKASGRPLILNPEQRQHPVDFVYALRKNRQMTYKELAKEFDFWDARHIAIKNALDREGFHFR